MKIFFYFLMAMSLTVAFSSCSDNGNGPGGGGADGDQIVWGEIAGDLEGIWELQGKESFATSDNYFVQLLFPTLLEMLNGSPEAEAYDFESATNYSQYWDSNQPNDPDHPGLYKESGTYVLNERDLTLTYTDGQTSAKKTEAYKIVSLSNTHLVLYKNILGIWGELASDIIGPFDKLGLRPQSAWAIITYTKSDTQ